MLGYEPFIFFLKDPGVLSPLVGLAVVSVFGHLVDEEKGQRLDPLGKENLFLLKVSPDGFPDLNPPYSHLRDVAGCLARAQNMAVGKFNCVRVGIDLGDNEAAVLVQLVGFSKEVPAFLQTFDYPLDPSPLADFHLNSGQRRPLGNLEGFQVEVGVGAG